MAVNIGPKIGIDGEKEYRKQINDLITQQKTFSSELKLVESEFKKETTEMEKNRKKKEVLTKAVNNQKKQVSELEKGLEASRKKYGENSTQTKKWEQAVNNAKTELNRLERELDKVPNKLQSVGSEFTKQGEKLKTAGETLTNSITTPIMGLASSCLSALGELKTGYDEIITKTGATGSQLAEMEQSMRNIATTIPTDFATAGAAIGEVNTRFGLTGKALEDLSTKFIKFAKLNKTDVKTSVDATDKILKAFGEDADTAGDLLDVLNGVSQDTGIDMNKLTTSLQNNAAQLAAMGMNSQQAASFLGSVETSGMSVESAMTAMNKALVYANKNGKTLPQVLSEFDQIMSSTASDQDKLNSAITFFGNKAGPKIYQACNEGTMSFKQFDSDTSKYLGNVDRTFNETVKGPEEMKTAVNTLKSAAGMLGDRLQEKLTPFVKKLGERFGEAAEAVGDLTDGQFSMIAWGLGIFAAIGPVTSLFGTLATNIGSAITQLGLFASGEVGLMSILGPIGIATAAILGLGIVLEGILGDEEEVDAELAQIVGNLQSSTEALEASTEKLNGVMEEAQGNIDDVEARASSANKLIDKLYELDSKTNKTALDQQRMKTIVAQLNEMYPELALSIDKSTGALNKSRQEVEKFVQQAYHEQLAKAYGEGAAKIIAQMAEQSVQHEKLLEDQRVAEEKYYEYLDELKKKYDSEDTGWLGEKVSFETWSQWDEGLKMVTSAMNDANQAVKDSKDAMDNAEQTYDLYIKKQDEETKIAKGMASETEKATKATEKNTKSTKDNKKELLNFVKALGKGADAEEDMADEVDDTTQAVTKQRKTIKDVAATIVQKAAEEAKAWGDTYKSAKDAINSKIGLFKEWKDEVEKSGEQLLNDMKQQNTDMRNYIGNIERLAELAYGSGSEYAESFVKELHEMGIDSAGEIAKLLKDLDAGKISIDDVLMTYGENNALKDNIANMNAAAQTEVHSGFQALMKAVKDNSAEIATQAGQAVGVGFSVLYDAAVKATGDLTDESKKWITTIKGAADTGFTGMEQVAKMKSQDTVKKTTTAINGMKLEPTVKTIHTGDAVQNASDYATGQLSGKKAPEGNVKTLHSANAVQAVTDYATGQLSGNKAPKGVVASLAVKSAATAAKESANNYLASVKGIISSFDYLAAAKNARSGINTYYQSNPIVVKARVQAEYPGGVHMAMYASGGFIKKQQIAMVGEGNKPEVVIPLSADSRSRAMDLYRKTGQILGADSVSRKTYVNGGQESIAISFDAEQLYAAVAAGAERGMENANVRIYWDNREAGRIMKDMGVVFA